MGKPMGNARKSAKMLLCKQLREAERAIRVVRQAIRTLPIEIVPPAVYAHLLSAAAAEATGVKHALEGLSIDAGIDGAAGCHCEEHIYEAIPKGREVAIPRSGRGSQ